MKTPYKTAKCPTCCPDGGAIFTQQYTYDADDNWQWVWQCSNCGHQKPIVTRERPDYTTCPATDAKKLNRWELLRFHLFNPAGLMAEWEAFGKEIDEAIEAGRVKTGFWLVYGPTGYHRDQLGKLAFAKKLRAWDANYTIDKIRETIDQGRIELAPK